MGKLSALGYRHYFGYNHSMEEVAVWDLKSQYDEYGDVKAFDCMIAEFLISYGKFVHSQQSILDTYKVTALDELAKKQRQTLALTPDLQELFDTIEMPLIPILWHMEQRGILLDTKKLVETGKLIDKEITTLEEKIKDHIGFEINLNSPIQVGNYLVEKESVPLPKTKTGKYATNESELSQFKDQFPIIADLLTYRALAKLKSTYINALFPKVDEDGRIHTTYHQVSVNTGRLASSNPNLQNIPFNSPFGQQIKSCFLSSPGYSLVSFDYSQQELRILAHLTQEEKLIEAFTSGKDVHKTTASQIFHVDHDAVTKQQRAVGKTINFGIIYGMSSFGLSQALTIPVEEAQLFIDTFFSTYPKIRIFYDKYLKDAQTHGHVKTLLGRYRYVFEYPGKKYIDNSTRRVLLNYPIQGSAADLMKKAMIDISHQVLAKNQNVYLLLQIHDDLVFEIPNTDEKELQSIISEIKHVMCTIYPLSVPVEVDVKVGKNWGEMNEYKE